MNMFELSNIFIFIFFSFIFFSFIFFSFIFYKIKQKDILTSNFNFCFKMSQKIRLFGNKIFCSRDYNCNTIL